VRFTLSVDGQFRANVSVTHRLSPEDLIQVFACAAAAEWLQVTDLPASVTQRQMWRLIREQLMTDPARVPYWTDDESESEAYARWADEQLRKALPLNVVRAEFSCGTCGSTRPFGAKRAGNWHRSECELYLNEQ
jgi:hypothetical protein